MTTVFVATCDLAGLTNPRLALGVLIRAGLAGLTSGYDEPEDAAEADLAGVPALPDSLESALKALESDGVVRSWFDPSLLATQLSVKRTELAHLDGLDDAERTRRIADVY
ncbi:glutamine synthetase [Saccharopolyspora shandongensis]|uniref:Glutamine synthetase n=1 Tax=Saccharopolyspora shandongensis TaxID=418495 RepID=A0A1H3JVI8_9PSEU|nr:hypothetical protein [Saccharopolyspora shandongensis]SDY43264.1 glutamine synthetase [Saccharopolyspora shandongensis]